MSIKVTNVILDAFIIVSAALAVLVSLLTISLMLFDRSTKKAGRTAHLLNLNMSVSLFIGCAIMLDIYCYTLYGHLHPGISFDGQWCQVKAYLFYVSGCGFFYSYFLQAIYRLCRIVYHTRPAFQSFKLYVYGIILQWSLSFVQVMPVYFLRKFQYLDADYHCQIAINNLPNLLIGLALVYIIPVSLTTACYVYTMMYIRTRTARVRCILQKAKDRRDYLVLTRIVLLLGVMILSGIPTLGISLFSQFSGYLPDWATQFQWLTATFSICCVSIILLFVSPSFKKLWKKPRGARNFIFHI